MESHILEPGTFGIGCSLERGPTEHRNVAKGGGDAFWGDRPPPHLQVKDLKENQRKKRLFKQLIVERETETTVWQSAYLVDNRAR